MKCKLLRDEERHAETPDEIAVFNVTGRLPVVPAGTVLDEPKAYMLVQFGQAEPADEECRIAAGMTADQQAAAVAAQEKVRRGIAPEDYDAFDRGEMTGYDANGEWIPGPNFVAEDDSEPSGLILPEDYDG